jgi:hypothetical protein
MVLNIVLILENFTKLFESVWSQFAKDMEEKENRKRKKKKERKINKKGQGAPFRPSKRSSPWPISFTSRTGTLALSLFH